MRATDFDFASFHTAAGDSRFHVRGTPEWDLREAFIKSVTTAFSSKPDLAARLHGDRKLLLGKRGDSRSSLFPSKKNAGAADVAVYIQVESRVEQAYALCLERNPGVVAYRTQAVKVNVPGGGKHWPDFLILDDQDRVFVREIKQSTEFLKEDYLERTNRVRDFLAQMGVDYEILQRSDLPTESELQNLKLLHHSYSRIPGTLELEFANAALQSLLPCTYRALIEALGDVAKHLLFTGRLRIDWQRPLNLDTEVTK